MFHRMRTFGVMAVGFVAGIAFVVACGSRNRQARVHGFDAGSRDSGQNDSGRSDSGLFDSGWFDSGFFDSGLLDSGIDAGRDAAAQAVECDHWEVVEAWYGGLAATGELFNGDTIYAVPAGWFPVAWTAGSSRITLRRCVL